MVPPCCTLWNSAIVRVIQIIVDIFGWKLKVTAGKGQSLIMAQILQRDLFVRRLSIYQVRISRLISRWISRWIWSSNFRVTPWKGTLDDLGFWIPRCGFPDSCTGFLIFLKNWNLDFGFQLLVGFRIPKTRIPYSTSEFVPDSGFFKQNFPSLHSSNTHHASEVKALCITAHCYTCSSDTDATYVKARKITKAPWKRTQHCWPTTPNIVGCYMLRPSAHSVECCCALLEVVAKKVWNR